jgi:hypothetical protein
MVCLSDEEQYYCQFGLNPHYQATIHDGGLRVVGVDEAGEARIVELAEHPFFVATLFVPPLTSTAEQPHALIIAYLQAAVEYSHMPSTRMGCTPEGSNFKEIAFSTHGRFVTVALYTMTHAPVPVGGALGRG